MQAILTLSHAVEIRWREIRKEPDYNPVRYAHKTANTEIIEQAQKDEGLRGMGTTMVVSTDRLCCKRKRQLSHASLCRDRSSRLQSIIYCQEMVRLGEISRRGG